MAEAVKIAVEARDPQKNKGTGTRVARGLRARGRIPAIIYGHKKVPVPISVAREAVWEMIKKSTHLSYFSDAATTETVLVRDVQWDHLGKEILHLDFARVSAEESIETEVRLDVRGLAAGVAEGGVLEQPVHTVSVTCRAAAIPDAIRIDVSGLQVGQAVHVRELSLPPGVTVNDDPELLLVHVVSRAVTVEPTPTAEGEAPTQPEVIKPERKEKEE
ncbi:MAG: 50S ribosomal protein L25 [Planctomycetaceae bacterium]|nr:50S ribosomal protein L25 [Planctomycetaceae bacterium]